MHRISASFTHLYVYVSVCQLRDGHAVVVHCLANKLMRGGGVWAFDMRQMGTCAAWSLIRTAFVSVSRLRS